jgi:hypothetical protein
MDNMVSIKSMGSQFFPPQTPVETTDYELRL